MRSVFVVHCCLWLLCLPTSAKAQVLSGQIDVPGAQGQWLVLLATRGSDHYPVDSVVLGTHGAFRFAPAAGSGTGFYQLAYHDSDRVDIILSTKEPVVEVSFSSLPLQRSITVLRSEENRLLWRYKSASRQLQAVQETVAREKGALDPMDIRRIMALDSIEQQATRRKDKELSEILSSAPQSYFTKVVEASASLDREIANGPMAVSGIFDFGDPELLRSSVYDKAVMAFIQSINAVSEEQLTNASDTLMLLASRNEACRDYMIEHLVDLYTVYGPQSTLQHLVDRYLAGDRPQIPMSPRIRSKVERLLAVSIGAQGPDVLLWDTLGVQRPLSVVSKGHRFTLLFFYSSTCDHCHAQMPGVNDLVQRYGAQGFGVVGIALDDDRTEFRGNIVERGLRFPCFSEFNGWGSAAAKAYEVKATPTLILLDDSRRIIAKPYDAKALGQELAGRLP